MAGAEHIYVIFEWCLETKKVGNHWFERKTQKLPLGFEAQGQWPGPKYLNLSLLWYHPQETYRL